MRGFNEIYEQIYKESKEELEKLRIKQICKRPLVILAELSCAMLLYYFVCLRQTKLNIPFLLDVFLILFIFFLLFAIESALNSNKNKNNNYHYNKLFKEKVIKKIVEGYSEKLNYNPNVTDYADNQEYYNKYVRELVVQGLEKELRRNLMDNDNTKLELHNEILSYFLNSDYAVISRAYSDSEFEEKYYSFYYEDTIYGQLNEGHNFTMTEIKTEKENGNIKGETIGERNKFQGIFVTNQFEHNVNTVIKIRDNFKISLFNNDIKLEMDSSEFEEAFNVYAENKIIAMQLLTSDIIQMLVDFKNETNIVPEITIKNSNLYIRLKTGDLFEANMFKDSLDYSTLKKYYDIVKFSVELSEKLVDSIVQTEL